MPSISHSPVLIIDDEPLYLQSASINLRFAGFEVITLSDQSQLFDLLKSRRFTVILLDILMQGKRGDELLESIIATSPQSAVIMITAVNDLETAVSCMRKGAFDYIVKPVEKERLVTTVKRAAEMAELRIENRRLKDGLLDNKLNKPQTFESIVTRDPQMFSIFRYIEAIGQTPMPVLIRGETGTGKELIARAIHLASGRPGEFVCVNAAGMTDILFCDSLFGHEKGAFTGADAKRAGLVARATGGTLFLDEIGDMAPESQIKLLRFLEERTYYPIGSDTPRTSDARIIAATNRDIDQIRKNGTFRDDLYYRLEAHIVEIPPLRQRRNDIPLLIDHFIEQTSLNLGKQTPIVDSEFYSICSRYAFPGNIRELRNVISDLISITNRTQLFPEDLPPKITQNAVFKGQIYSHEFNQDSLKMWQTLPAIKDVEQLLIDEALRRSNGNQTIAAQLLGMTRSALNKRIIRAKQEN